jgi:hypothetical protein
MAALLDEPGHRHRSEHRSPNGRLEASSYPYPFEGDSQDVDETLTFSVPITFSTAFNLGIYGVSGVGGRNQSSVGSAHSDFSHSMYWAGVRGVLVNGQLIENRAEHRLNAGIDWMKSLVPAAPPMQNRPPCAGGPSAWRPLA